MVTRTLLRNLPIRRKLRAIIVIISGTVVVGASALFVAYEWFTAREQRARRLEVVAEIVGSHVAPAVEFDQAGPARTILSSLRGDHLILAGAVYARDGRLFATYLREGTDPSLVPSLPDDDGPVLEGGHLRLTHPLYSGRVRIGSIYLRADLQDIREMLWTNVAILGVLLLAATIAAYFLAGRLGRLVTIPIQRLSDVMETVGRRRDYSVRVEGGGRDEVGRLIEGFNDMLGQVEDRNAELAQARDELELRVKERTRELEQEVADRRDAERRLQEHEARLVEAQHIAQMGSWVWDPASNRVDWSDELFRIMGVLPSRFGNDFSESLQWVHPDDRKPIQEAMARSRDVREPFESEIRIIRPDGTPRILRLQGKPVVNDAGATVRLVGTAQDITERKRIDQAVLQLNEELKAKVEEVAAANKELEGFSYSVSHDLRAPLRAIHGYSQMLLEDHLAAIDEEGRRFLQVITGNTVKMGRLIDDLLEFSRLGRKELRLGPIDMSALASEVCEDARNGSPGRNLEFRLDGLSGALGDLSMIRVVLTNLVSNAVKYSKGRTPAVIEIGARPGEGETVYFVKDNGVGFEMQYAHKLFGVFQRLHPSEEFEGTGVGLALVQRIVLRHGGRVWAEGHPGEGATISFSLPVGPPPPECV